MKCHAPGFISGKAEQRHHQLPRTDIAQGQSLPSRSLCTTCGSFWTGDFCEISGPCDWCFLVLRRIVTFSGFRQKIVQPQGTSCQSSVSSEKAISPCNQSAFSIPI